MTKNRAILLNGKFPEKINGIPTISIPECDPNNENNWMGWVKNKLEEKGWQVVCPTIPQFWKAGFNAWKKELDKLIIDENTTLVGLSSGGGTWLKWLAENKRKVKKLIIVACGAYPRNGSAERKNYPRYVVSTNLKKQIKKGSVIFISDDEPYKNIREWAPKFQKELDARLIKVKNYGHFSFLVKEFPELLKELLL